MGKNNIPKSYYIIFHQKAPAINTGKNLLRPWAARNLAPLVCVLVLLTIATLMSGCGANSKKGTPEDAVNDFMQAQKSRDVDKYWNVLSDDFKTGQSKEQLIEEAKSLGSGSGISWKIDEVNIDGDNATASGIVRNGQVKARFNFSLVKENGAWKVNSQPDFDIL